MVRDAVSDDLSHLSPCGCSGIQVTARQKTGKRTGQTGVKKPANRRRNPKIARWNSRHFTEDIERRNTQCVIFDPNEGDIRPMSWGSGREVEVTGTKGAPTVLFTSLKVVVSNSWALFMGPLRAALIRAYIYFGPYLGCSSPSVLSIG